MMDSPKKYDVVLGGHSKVPADGVVLGGVERVKQLLAHGRVEQKIDALLDAFEYGKAGLEIIIHSLHDSSREVREAAYFLLQESTELSAKKVLQEYIPYEFFKCLHRWNDDTHIALCFSISSDWKILVSANDEECNLRNLITGQLIRTLDIDLPIMDISRDIPKKDVTIAFTPDTQTLVTGSEGIIYVGDIQTDEIIRTLKGNYVSCATIFNKRTVYRNGIYYDDYSDAEHPVKVWNLLTGELVSTIYGHTGKQSDLIVNPKEQFLTVIDFHYSNSRGYYDIVIKKWDLQTGEQIDTFNMPISESERNFLPTLSQDRKTLVSCSGVGNWDGSIKVWNLETKKIIHILQGYPPFYLSPKANFLVSNVSRADNTIILWDLLKGEKIHTLQASSPVAFSTDGKVLVSGGAKNIIIVWDLQTGEKLCVLEGHSTQIGDIVISPDGRTIVSSSVETAHYHKDGTIKV